jgi:hypothetical protein
MSGGTKDSLNPGNSKDQGGPERSMRWAALDSQLERLVSAADWAQPDPATANDDRGLKAAS